MPIVKISALALVTVGCRGSQYPPTARVSGQVTIDGNPVKMGRISFYIEKGRMASGEILDGEYSLRTFEKNDGALLGNHIVTIKAVEVTRKDPPNFKPPPNLTPAQIEDLRTEEAIVTAKWIVPPHYSNRKTSPLTAEVKPGKNEINFPLQSK